MLRTKIVILVGVLLSAVIALGGVLYWGTQRVEYYFQRSQLAYTALEAYLRLSQDVYRHFKEHLDTFIKDLDPANTESVASYEQLKKSLEDVRAATHYEMVHSAHEGYDGEVGEGERVGSLEALIAEGRRTFERIHRLHKEGREQDARRELRVLLDVLIDRRLRPLIDEAVADERAEVVLAERRAALLIHRLRLTAAAVALLAVGFALTVGSLLFRRLKSPLDTLICGTREMAGGNLAHRIEIEGQDELARLAAHINIMARELEQQHEQLVGVHLDLEKKVKERTVELLDANDKLRHLDEVRRQFFADISHELRTPLTIIRGEAEVTLRGRTRESDEYRTTLSRIVELTQQLSNLVDDLLFLARCGTEGARFNFIAVELNDLTSEAWKDAVTLAQKRQLNVTLALPENEVCVRGDRLRLKQMLHILIDNAVHYSKIDGLISLAVEVENNGAIIRIADQGIGIPHSEQAGVFERFFRGNKAHRMVPTGLGLGLPLAKSIVDVHKGVITLSSKENEGTVVTVKLPLCANEYERVLNK